MTNYEHLCTLEHPGDFLKELGLGKFSYCCKGVIITNIDGKTLQIDTGQYQFQGRDLTPFELHGIGMVLRAEYVSLTNYEHLCTLEHPRAFLKELGLGDFDVCYKGMIFTIIDGKVLQINTEEYMVVGVGLSVLELRLIGKLLKSAYVPVPVPLYKVIAARIRTVDSMADIMDLRRDCNEYGLGDLAYGPDPDKVLVFTNDGNVCVFNCETLTGAYSKILNRSVQ